MRYTCMQTKVHAKTCYAMLCYAMLCYAMLCYAMLCYAMLCYAMLCYFDLKLVRCLCRNENAQSIPENHDPVVYGDEIQPH